MCGIAGILRLDGSPVDPKVLEEMSAALAHRGPDDTGTWIGGAVGLANRRLAIIGLGPQGRQPMCAEQGTWITYNGELYNFHELRAELPARGRAFRTESDTEVLLQAYAEWGEEFLERLNGMFAFAIWDGRRRTLLLARDRVGIKPLYVERRADQISFASELNALAPARAVAPDIDPVALDAYLALGYVPQPATIWCGVEALEPGTFVSWRDGAERTARYWGLAPNAVAAPRTFGEAAEGVRHAVEAAVRRQLTSDVPVALFLSGGMDSSSIAASVSACGARVETITASFREREFDETPQAALVARRWDLPHRSVAVTLEDWSALPRLVAQYGQPFADSSAVAVAALSRAIAPSCKVVLSGDGGDEVFGGYGTYLASHLAAVYARAPGPARTLLRAAAGALPVTHGRLGIRERLLRFVAGAEHPLPEAHLLWREYLDDAERSSLLGSFPGYAGPYALERLLATPLRMSAAFPGLDRYLALDVLTYLPSDMLCKVDVASMMHSVEVRLPLLDHEVVELAFSLPHSMKRDARSGKRVLRAAFERMLPRAVLWGRKRGLNVPIGRWLAGPLYEAAREILLAENARRSPALPRTEVERILLDHRHRRADNGHKLWALLVLVLWREGLDGRGRAWPVSDVPVPLRS